MTQHYKSRFGVLANPIFLVVVSIVIIITGGIMLLSRNDSSQTTRNNIIKAKTGVIAPNFTLPSTSGKKISLSDYKGKQNVLLYFNEGLSCDPCMQQIPELEKSFAEFKKMNVILLSIMYDPVDQLKTSEKQYSITTPILSYHDNPQIDSDYTLSANSMAMKNRAGHTFVLVNTDGKIIWRKDYWPGQGMMVQGGVMFVNGSEIINQVKRSLRK